MVSPSLLRRARVARGGIWTALDLPAVGAAAAAMAMVVVVVADCRGGGRNV